MAFNNVSKVLKKVHCWGGDKRFFSDFMHIMCFHLSSRKFNPLRGLMTLFEFAFEITTLKASKDSHFVFTSS